MRIIWYFMTIQIVVDLLSKDVSDLRRTLLTRLSQYLVQIALCDCFCWRNVFPSTILFQSLKRKLLKVFFSKIKKRRIVFNFCGFLSFRSSWQLTRAITKNCYLLAFELNSLGYRSSSANSWRQSCSIVFIAHVLTSISFNLLRSSGSRLGANFIVYDPTTVYVGTW